MVTDLQNIQFKFDTTGANGFGGSVGAGGSAGTAPRFPLDAESWFPAVPVGSIGAAERDAAGNLLKDGELAGQLSFVFNNTDQVYINKKISESERPGEVDQNGNPLLMNGTIWKDPIARITWTLALDYDSARTYTLLPADPGVVTKGDGTVRAEASPSSRQRN